MQERKIINSLYENFKNFPKKLKIVCDWDEVIQAIEPYALWKEIGNGPFPLFFKDFWKDGEEEFIKYSPYGSKLVGVKEITTKLQQEIKNSPNFCQEALFLTIAEDLLKLIKEDKVEQLIFLSAYDKRKFPKGDSRKLQIFIETFSRFGKEVEAWYDDKKLGVGRCPPYLSGEFVGDIPKDYNKGKSISMVELQLIGFESEEKGQSKADWIKENASDFDIVIDDNPNICRSIIKERCFITKTNKLCLKPAKGYFRTHSGEGLVCEEHWSKIPIFDKDWNEICLECDKPIIMEKAGAKIEVEGKMYHANCYHSVFKMMKDAVKRRREENSIFVCSPYYPAVENQHHKEVLLIKNEVSELLTLKSF